MNMIVPFLMEFQHETGSTRKLLERLPDEHFDWTPHEKSMPLGTLASHVAELVVWARPTVEQDELALDPATYQPWKGKSIAEIVAKFDENVADALSVLSGQTDEHLMQPWTMKVGGTAVFTLPRIAVLRSFCLNHQIHHRGQLTVYARLKGVALPQIYGPTADEPNMVPA